MFVVCDWVFSSRIISTKHQISRGFGEGENDTHNSNTPTHNIKRTCTTRALGKEPTNKFFLMSIPMRYLDFSSTTMSTNLRVCVVRWGVCVCVCVCV